MSSAVLKQGAQSADHLQVPAHTSILPPHRVEVALSRRLTEQEALVGLSQLALASGDPLTVMQQAAERLAEIQEVEVVSIMEQTASDELTVRAQAGPSHPNEAGPYAIHPGAPAGYALASGSPVLIEDLASDPRFADPVVLRERGMVSGMNVIIPARQGTYGVLGMWTSEHRRFSPDDVHFVQAVANLIGGILSRGEVESRLAEAVREKDRRLRNERALSRCAQALLGNYEPTAIETSLAALMEAIKASFGYVDWLDARNGSVPSVHLSRQGRTAELDRHWGAVSWDELPTLRQRLAAGQLVTIRVGDLPPHEAAPFLTGPDLVGTEIDVPILINGRWAGTLGLGDSKEERVWDRNEIQMLEMAASLLASWWQRRDYAERLEEALDSRNRSLRLEHAVAAASQVLSRATDPSDLRNALLPLLDGTDATSVFVERNVEDPVRGLCSTVVAVAQRPGSGYDQRYWDMMPWRRMPTTLEALAEGREMVLSAEMLDGEEAATYAASRVKSEIDVPIFVEGEWVGLIGISDEKSIRTWHDELQMLRTAADMIASFWGRLAAARKLEELMRSKDEFIASISHELRTPLTAVVGLAESLVQPETALSADEPAEFIRIIAEQSAEMSAIVQDLLVVARSDIGKVTIRSAYLDLVSEAQSSIRGLSPERRGDLSITGTARAYADPVRVRQIIRNLLANAGRYGGPNIHVHVTEATDQSRIVIKDDGPGVPPEDRERIFQPYERAHQRNGQPASVGLGLTVSRQLATLMGGSLTYDHVDGWSTFTLELPTSPLTGT